MGRLLRFYLVASAVLILVPACKTKKMFTDASSARNKEFKGNLKERYADLLGVSKREIDNERLYKFIDEWMGVPHKNGGTDKNGVDCSAFTNLLQKEVYDKTLPRACRQMVKHVKRKFEGELQEGDLVFFNFNGQEFNHVGVYLRNNKFVHTSNSRGVIISDLKDTWYYKYFSRAGSVR